MIADALGQRFVESIPLNLEAAWAESRVNTPLICLLSPGEALSSMRGLGLLLAQGTVRMLRMAMSCKHGCQAVQRHEGAAKLLPSAMQAKTRDYQYQVVCWAQARTR